jgi:hypothetical protein
MALSLIFSELSLNGNFIIDGSNFTIRFDVTNSGIQNLDTYLLNVPLYTPVAALSIQNPFGGALLNGALYYTSNSPNIQFTTDIVFNPGDNVVGIITLNFAYFGTIPIFSNGVFGGALLTYQIPNPYVVITNTNPLTIVPTNISTLPIITVYPNPDACFLEGTSILTPNGYVNIEKLNSGDEIIVNSLGIEKINNIKKIITYKSNKKDVYCISKENIGINNDLYITGGHAIKINNNYRHVKCLFDSECCDYKIKKCSDSNEYITYYHILLDDWVNTFIIANGLEIEPYYENSIVNDKRILWNCTKTQCNYKMINLY